MAYTKRKALPTQSYLEECFEVKSGGIYWKERPSYHFTSGVGKASGAKLAGNKVVGRTASKGYRQVRLEGVSYYLHRLVYKLTHDTEPELIDHIDGDCENNHPTNLRSASHSENKFNRKKPKNNSSGYKGVSFHKKNKKWVSQLNYKGKHIHIGCFDSPKNAHLAYLKKAQSLVGGFALGG